MASDLENPIVEHSGIERPSESAQDYLACIAELVEDKGYARVADVADALSVAEASACEMIKRLAKKGYLKLEKYRGFILTESGQAVACEIQSRRAVLTAFLQSLDLPLSVVRHDVHGLEHHLSQPTLERLQLIMRRGYSR
jgi:DtxR family transcriptional regulator, manganese transport regulator